MRFWDASAIVPLCVEQPATDVVRGLLDQDSAIAAWWGTPVECQSAFARLRREGLLTARDEESARQVLEQLRLAWLEIQPAEEVRALAGRLLRVHPLRSADALQLAAALVWAGRPPAGEIVVLDLRLQDAARLEGLVPRPGQ